MPEIIIYLGKIILLLEDVAVFQIKNIINFGVLFSIQIQ